MSNAKNYFMPLLLGALLGIALVSQAAAEDESTKPTITVVGTGKVSAQPDQGRINVGVVTRRPTAVDAMNDNSAAVREVFARLATLGVADKDIKTNDLSLNPVYNRRDKPQETPKIVGYEVTNQVQVVVRDLAKMGSILDAVVREGANRLNGVSFAVANPAALLDEARTKAIQDARRKARLYAGAAGVELGSVIAIQEGQPRFERPQQLRLARAAESIPIAPGQLDFRAHITVIYRIAEGRTK